MPIVDASMDSEKQSNSPLKTVHVDMEEIEDVEKGDEEIMKSPILQGKSKKG